MSKKLTPAEKLRKLTEKANQENQWELDDLEHWFIKYFLYYARRLAKSGHSRIDIKDIYPMRTVDDKTTFPPWLQVKNFLENKGFHHFNNYEFWW